MRHPTRPSIAAVAAVVALAAGCGGSSDEPAAEGAAAETATAAETTPEAPATTPQETVTAGAETTASPPAPTVVRIVVRDGRAVGGIRRVTVAQGDRVRLVVVTDSADEAHLHGYDLAAVLRPGAPGRITFVAKLPGRFELELEEAGVQIGELQVRP